MGDRPHSALSPVFTALFLLLSTGKCLQNRSIRVVILPPAQPTPTFACISQDVGRNGSVFQGAPLPAFGSHLKVNVQAQDRKVLVGCAQAATPH